MFYTGTPLFPFGFGLSYTSFSLEWGAASSTGTAAVPVAMVSTALPNVTFTVKVRNTGSRAGKETVMAYWSPPATVDADLKRQLFDFQGVRVTHAVWYCDLCAHGGAG